MSICPFSVFHVSRQGGGSNGPVFRSVLVRNGRNPKRRRFPCRCAGQKLPFPKPKSSTFWALLTKIRRILNLRGGASFGHFSKLFTFHLTAPCPWHGTENGKPGWHGTENGMRGEGSLPRCGFRYANTPARICRGTPWHAHCPRVAVFSPPHSTLPTFHARKAIVVASLLELSESVC